MIFPYADSLTINAGEWPAGSQINNTGNNWMRIERKGHEIAVNGSINGGLPTFGAGSVALLPDDFLPRSLRPGFQTWFHGEMSGDAILTRGTFATNGGMGVFKGFNGGGLFTSSHTYTNGNLWFSFTALK